MSAPQAASTQEARRRPRPSSDTEGRVLIPVAGFSDAQDSFWTTASSSTLAHLREGGEVSVRVKDATSDLLEFSVTNVSSSSAPNLIFVNLTEVGSEWVRPIELLNAEAWRSVLDYRPRTELGKRLVELRKKVLAEGLPLFDTEDLAREIAERRGTLGVE